jgi:hypothetical protein
MVQLGPLSVHRRTYRVVCSAVAVVAVGVGGTGTYLATQWNRTTTVELADVLHDFRDAATSAEDGDVEPSTTAVAPAAAETTVPTVAPQTTPTPSTAPPDHAAPPVVPSGPAPFTPPPEGVYTYAATGGERISVGGASHSYPAQVFAVLTHTACGFRLQLRVIEEHIDTIDHCIDGTRLAFKSSHQRMTFLGNTAEGSFGCDPPIVLIDRAVAPGARQRATCAAGSIVVSSTAEHTADSPVSIDGATVTGSRATWRWEASGETSGSGAFTWVFDEHGMPLSLERTGTTTSPSVLGRATHEETARFVLQSRVPKR